VTFANGLRSILRQDPDVILVGEVRDKETAEIAHRAALTGHLVLTTLHTNNAISSIARLMDIGLEPYIIASSLLMVIAQRLLKLNCVSCKETYTPDPGLLEKFRGHLNQCGVTRFYRGKGCPHCRFAGYRGRSAVVEILSISPAVRELITERASEEKIFHQARQDGFEDILTAGIRKVANGETSLEEIARITDMINLDEAGDKGRSQGAIRVVVADDDRFMRALVIDALRKEQVFFEFHEAEDGQSALESVMKNKPDLLISDVLMPRMDGIELVRRIRGRLETASLPVVLLTAQTDKTSEIKGFDAGADDYIAKPFDKEKLSARVRTLLRRNKRDG
jgi:CheY-like chemotaxis protein